MICKNCLRKIKEPLHKKFAKAFFKGIFYFTSMLGFLALYNFMAGDVYQKPDLLFSIGGAYSFLEDFRAQFRQVDYFKPIADNITQGCTTSECRAYKIYSNLTSFPYVVGQEQDPVKIWKASQGDCDEMSILYIAMLKSENIPARIQCNHNHCWTIVMLQNKRIIADIVNDKWETVEV